MRGNQTSYRFACAPPAIEEYLALIPIEDNSSEDEIIDADGIDKGDKSADEN